MSFLDNLFGGADNAAQAQIAGINKGLTAATDATTAGSQALTTNYTAALQPFLANQKTAAQGTNALGDVLGLNGAAGSNNAQNALATTPGYQFALGAGENAVNAGAAASGQIGSGGQAMALQKMGIGTANQNYNNYVSQLQPYMGMAGQAASGIGNTYGSLGSSLNANQINLGNQQLQGEIGIGNAQASADLADQSMGMGLLGAGLNLATMAIPGSSMLGGLGKGLSSGFGMSQWSDERLKDDIEPVGELFDGQAIYRYTYKGEDVPRIGLMAQEVAEVNPDAVDEFGGFLAVNYERATDRAAELARFLG